MAAIVAIICVPLIFAWFGGTQQLGLIIGVVLFAGGLMWMLVGSREP
jgi:hypothetical protein